MLDWSGLQRATSTRPTTSWFTFGRWLYENGKPYSHYSETIKFCSLQSALRSAGCFSQRGTWREEPAVHHTAMPWQILVVMLTTCLLYGWASVAGCLALSWGGLARVGEVLAARCADRVLPEDTGEHAENVLLAVHEPKTRFCAARHQCLRVDQPQDNPLWFWDAGPR